MQSASNPVRTRMDAVMRAIGKRGYLADWTNESPAQEKWR